MVHPSWQSFEFLAAGDFPGCYWQLLVDLSYIRTEFISTSAFTVLVALVVPDPGTTSLGIVFCLSLYSLVE